VTYDIRIHTYTYTYVYTYIYIYIYIYVRVYVHVRISIFLSIYLSINKYIHIYTHTYIVVGCGSWAAWSDAEGNGTAHPTWRQPRGTWMVFLVNSHTNATSNGWHLWEIDLRLALHSTLGWDKIQARGIASCTTPPLPRLL